MSHPVQLEIILFRSADTMWRTRLQPPFSIARNVRVPPPAGLNFNRDGSRRLAGEDRQRGTLPQKQIPLVVRVFSELGRREVRKREQVGITGSPRLGKCSEERHGRSIRDRGALRALVCTEVRTQVRILMELR